jgi:hypothetical protein
MFRRRREPLLTRGELDALIAMIMRIDDNVERIRSATVDEDGEAEEDRP